MTNFLFGFAAGLAIYFAWHWWQNRLHDRAVDRLLDQCAADALDQDPPDAA